MEITHPDCLQKAGGSGGSKGFVFLSQYLIYAFLKANVTTRYRMEVVRKSKESELKTFFRDNET
jgi:hypothetical protein